MLKRSKSKGYEKIHTHNMLPLESFIKNGYLKNFPQHVMVASHVKRNLKSIDKTSSLIEPSKISKSLDNPKLVISPTVCYHIFETLKDSNLKFDTIFDSISILSKEISNIKCSTHSHKPMFLLSELGRVIL